MSALGAYSRDGSTQENESEADVVNEQTMAPLTTRDAIDAARAAADSGDWKQVLSICQTGHTTAYDEVFRVLVCSPVYLEQISQAVSDPMDFHHDNVLGIVCLAAVRSQCHSKTLSKSEPLFTSTMQGIRSHLAQDDADKTAKLWMFLNFICYHGKLSTVQKMWVKHGLSRLIQEMLNRLFLDADRLICTYHGNCIVNQPWFWPLRLWSSMNCNLNLSQAFRLSNCCDRRTGVSVVMVINRLDEKGYATALDNAESDFSFGWLSILTNVANLIATPECLPNSVKMKLRTNKLLRSFARRAKHGLYKQTSMLQQAGTLLEDFLESRVDSYSALVSVSVLPAGVCAEGIGEEDCPALMISSNCANCGLRDNESHKLRKCSRCKLISYCSVACSAAHWRIHKKQCGIPLLVDSDSPPVMGCDATAQNQLSFRPGDRVKIHGAVDQPHLNGLHGVVWGAKHPGSDEVFIELRSSDNSQSVLTPVSQEHLKLRPSQRAEMGERSTNFAQNSSSNGDICIELTDELISMALRFCDQFPKRFWDRDVVAFIDEDPSTPWSAERTRAIGIALSEKGGHPLMCKTFKAFDSRIRKTKGGTFWGQNLSQAWSGIGIWTGPRDESRSMTVDLREDRSNPGIAISLESEADLNSWMAKLRP